MNKREYVYQEIKKSIENGRWKVGDQISSEYELCQEFQVSRQPVRNAIKSLTEEGILEPRRGSGTFVSKIPTPPLKFNLEVSLNDLSLADCFEFRRILETESAAIAAARASSDMVRQLRDLIYEIKNAKSLELREETDLAFHSLIAKATGNTALISVSDILLKYYKSFIFQNLNNLRQVEMNENTEQQKLLDEHLQIYIAIETRNPDLARKNMEKLLNSSMLKLSKAGFDF